VITPRREGLISKREAARRVELWNDAHEIGTAVEVTKDDGTVFTTHTRSTAWLLGGHTPVVQIEGVAGCHALNRVAPARGVEDSAPATRKGGGS
jgi:hypothetical protein